MFMVYACVYECVWYMHVYAHVRVHSPICACVEATCWVCCHTPPFCFEAGSLTEPGPGHFGSFDWTASPQDPLVSTPRSGVTGVLCQAWLWHESWDQNIGLMLYSRHLAHWAISPARNSSLWPCCDYAHPCIPKVGMLSILHLLYRCTFPLRWQNNFVQGKYLLLL